MFVLQATDPLASGWDLFGVGDWQAQTIVSMSIQSWTSLVLLELGAFLTLGGLYRRSIARFGTTAGVRAGWVFAGFVLAAAIFGLKLLVGVK